MAVKEPKYEAIFHYVDDKGYGGDISIHEDTLDDLTVRLSAVQEYAQTQKWTGRPADRDKAPSTFVQVNKPRVSKNPNTPSTDPMAAAAAATGMGMDCPVCQTPMSFRQADGALAKSGRFAGQPLPDRYNCPNCQKTVWLGRKTQEIPF